MNLRIMKIINTLLSRFRALFRERKMDEEMRGSAMTILR